MDKGLQPTNGDVYVASADPPEARRPPIAETGAIRWARENLFKTRYDVLLTVTVATLVGLFLYNFLEWVIFKAQWEVAFLNLRTHSLGLSFPREQIWRVDMVVLIVIFLSLFSVAVWGSMNAFLRRSVLVVLAAMYIVPILAGFVPKTAINVWVQEGFVRVMNFTADADQTIGFAVIPQTDENAFAVSDLAAGYYENNNRQAGTSFDTFNERSANVVAFGTVDPSEYDLNFRIVVVGRNGNILETSEFTGGSTDEFTFEWTAPRSGWYATYVEFDEEAPGVGSAWLRLENIEVFRSTSKGRADVAERYGEIPEASAIAEFCTNCVTTTTRTSLRFEGRRTLGEFVSLQMAPAMLETRGLFTQMVIVGGVGYLLGLAMLSLSFGAPDTIRGAERTVTSGGGFLILLYFGVQFSLFFNPGAVALNQISFLIFGTLVVIALSYAGLQFIKGDKRDVSRGLVILWLISIPVIWTMLTGFAAIGGEPNTRFPIISSQNYGGMLLTLLLSAVSIVLSFPLGVLLALGRQSDLPVVSLTCTLFIEFVRGVPLITLLFFGRFILPFFGFGLGDVDLIVRTMVMLTLFTAAYMAEVVRGGLQIIPKGQIEAAQALGLNGLWTTIFIKLPQALRAVIPAIMGQSVSLFKDTSLVFIIGLFEMLGTMNQVLSDAQTGYTIFTREGYLYVGVAYFLFAYLMADISRRVERTGAGSIRRNDI